jgi:hypothetical protein
LHNVPTISNFDRICLILISAPTIQNNHPTTHVSMMKTPIRLVVLPLLCVCHSAFSEVLYSGDWAFTLDPSNEATITAYSGPGGAVIIPSTIEGFSVKTFGNGVDPVFGNGTTSVTSVTIPESIINIQGFAFYGCTGLTSVTIPDSVTYLGEHAFQYCTGLINLSIGNNVTSIPNWSFAHCSALQNATIPDSVISIGGYAFAYCTSLNTLTLGNGVEGTGYAALEGCTALTSLTIPSSVIYLAPHTFNGCDNLKEIYFLGNPPSVEYGVFWWLPTGKIYYPVDATGWGPTFEGWPTESYSLSGTDSDGDGVNDYREGKDGTDPNDAASFNPLSVGLVAYYPFDGNANDESGYMNHAVTINGTYLNDVCNDFDRQVVSLGINSSIITPLWSGNKPTSGTIVCLVKHEGISNENISSIWNASAGCNDFALVIKNFKPYIWAKFNDCSALHEDVGFYQTAHPRFTHYVVSWTPSGTKAYQDGQLVGQSTNPFQTGSQYPISIGNNFYEVSIDNHFAGKIDEFRVYERAISDTDVKKLYYDLTFTIEQQDFVSNNPNTIGYYSQLQYDANRAAGRQDVISDPATYGLFTASSIMDLNLGGLMLQKQGDSVTLNLEIQKTDDLVTTPFAPFENISLPVTMPGNKGFLRVRAISNPN